MKKHTKIGCGILFALGTILFFALIITLNNTIMTGYDEGVPMSVDYHDSIDLYKISNVEFPEVVLVDSSYYNNWSYDETNEMFILKNPLDKTDLIKKIESKMLVDSIYWNKTDSSYEYYLIPELPIDRPNGTGWRKMENGELAYQGNFIRLYVPIASDTIILKYGWSR